MRELQLFLFVLSIIYILRFIVELAIRLIQDNPDALTLKKYEQYLHYISLAYIITYILI
jgi:Na+-driven multidrug efflux pump